MTDPAGKYDMQFYQLVISLHAAAMQQMGKIANPFSGQVERDLTQAQASIGMLEMVQKKTDGNLTEDEKKLIDHVIYELRMNYVEEEKKGPDAPPEAKPDEVDGASAKESDNTGTETSESTEK